MREPLALDSAPDCALARDGAALALVPAGLARRCQVPALQIRSRKGFVDPAVIPTLGPNWHFGEVVGAGHFVQQDASTAVTGVVVQPGDEHVIRAVPGTESKSWACASS